MKYTATVNYMQINEINDSMRHNIQFTRRQEHSKSPRRWWNF